MQRVAEVISLVGRGSPVEHHAGLFEKRGSLVDLERALCNRLANFVLVIGRKACIKRRDVRLGWKGGEKDGGAASVGVAEEVRQGAEREVVSFGVGRKQSRLL